MEDLSFGIDKWKIREKLRGEILERAPHLHFEITNKLLNEIIVYLKGYISCFKTYIEPPYNDVEVRELLYGEAIDYALKKVLKT